MNKNCLGLCLLLSLALPSFAKEDKTHRWDGSIEVSREDESSVVVDEIDNVSRADSASMKYKASLRYRYRPYEHTKASISYSLSTKNYDDASGFDSDLNMLSASFGREFEHFTLGVRGQLIDSELAGAEFLEIDQVSPYVSFFLSKKWFVNASYRYSDKEIISNPDRSASSDTYTADVYYFIRGVRNFWIFSVRSKTEEATNALYDYELKQARISYTRRYNWWDWDHKLRVNWRFQERDYNSLIDPVIGDFRRDLRRQWQFIWDIEFTDNWMLGLEYKRNDNNSNSANSDYDQNSTSVSLEYSF
ncbi:MAG: hypothetical protein GJ680_11950 [Alteromonadaceae bacterium]|nr:hypothetical protein [Alteromonadaceae bacterium]